MVIDGDMEGVVSESVDPSSVNLVVHEVPEVRRSLSFHLLSFIGVLILFLAQ